MDIDQLRSFCLNKKAVAESFPFDEDTLVFKVGSKMFCLASLEPPFTINIKCDPEKVVELHEEFKEVKPGYHMNKKYWITIDLDGNLSNDFLESLIAESYELVADKLTKKERFKLGF